MQIAPSPTSAAASASGLVAVAHAHFAKNVTLYDHDANVLGRFARIGNYNFIAPADVAVGESGDFYLLDQGNDQVIRMHPDGIRCGIYRIPHEPEGDGKEGYLTRIRVCEKTQRLYALNWASLRCYSLATEDFSLTPELLWTLEAPGRNPSVELSWGYGGFDVDEDGILYLMNPLDEAFLTSFDADGKFLKKIPLQMEGYSTKDPTRVLGMRVSKGEVFVKRQHESELFLRFDLTTGALLTAATAPKDFSAVLRVPATVDDGAPIPPTASTQGIPDGRKTLRVLFIGNSQVNCIRDIPDMIEEISRSSTDIALPIIVSDEVLVGGTGLEGYWKEGLARKRITAGGWDYIVINEIVYSFGLTSTEKFTEYATLFHQAATQVDAKLLIFSTADVEGRRDMQQRMHADALQFAKTKHCRVAGAGMAWLKAWALAPDLDFHHTDRAHPNALGCYLNACVLYAVLTDSNPSVQNISTCDAADPAQAKIVQAVAWQQYLEDREQEK